MAKAYPTSDPVGLKKKQENLDDLSHKAAEKTVKEQQEEALEPVTKEHQKSECNCDRQ
jgi:hypothetical protein